MHIIIEYIYLTYKKIITPASNFLSLSFFPHLLPSYPWFSPPHPRHTFFPFFSFFLLFSFHFLSSLIFSSQLLSNHLWLLTPFLSCFPPTPPSFPSCDQFPVLTYNKNVHVWLGTYEILYATVQIIIFTLWQSVCTCDVNFLDVWDNNNKLTFFHYYLSFEKNL